MYFMGRFYSIQPWVVGAVINIQIVDFIIRSDVSSLIDQLGGYLLHFFQEIRRYCILNQYKTIVPIVGLLISCKTIGKAPWDWGGTDFVK